MDNGVTRSYHVLTCHVLVFTVAVIKAQAQSNLGKERACWTYGLSSGKLRQELTQRPAMEEFCLLSLRSYMIQDYLPRTGTTQCPQTCPQARITSSAQRSSSLLHDSVCVNLTKADHHIPLLRQLRDLLRRGGRRTVKARGSDDHKEVLSSRHDGPITHAHRNHSTCEHMRRLNKFKPDKNPGVDREGIMRRAS